MKNKACEINNSPLKAYIVITGGGTRFFPNFLELGGGSNTLIGGEVLYSQKAFDYFIKQNPDKYASKRSSIQLSTASFMKG